MAVDSVLLIAFKYPPYSEVGSRRWARLSRRIAEQGVQVHVLTVRWGKDRANTMDMVTHPNIHIHRVPSLGFHRLRNRRYWPKRLQGKLVRVLKEHEMLEDARFWGLVFVPYARRLIRRHGIRHVVVTGAPFRANWWVLKLKRRCPELALVQDLRDPWTDHPARMAEREEAVHQSWTSMEQQVLHQSDAIVTVTEPLKNLLAAKTSRPVYSIPNGYDVNDFPPLTPCGPRPFTLLHAGTVGSGRYEPFANLLAAVADLSSEIPELRVAMWGGAIPEGAESEAAQLERSGILELHDRVSASEMMRHIRCDAFACLHFEARDMSAWALSSKIFEYAYAKRPVLSVNYGGDIARLIEEHSLGWSVQGDDRAGIREAIRMLYRKWREDPAMETESTDVEAYDYRNLAVEYLEVLNSPRPNRSDQTV